MTLTSQKLTDKEALTILTGMFGFSKDGARMILTRAYDMNGQWTQTKVVQAIRYANDNGGSMFRVRYLPSEDSCHHRKNEDGMHVWASDMLECGGKA